MPDPVVPYKDSDLSKKKQVAKMFDNVARRYDLLNRLLSLGIDRYWRWRMINQLKPLQPQLVLDMATGTGDVALALARQLKPKKIVAVNLSPLMLAYGKVKVRRARLDKMIDMQVGDAENLPFEGNTFDAITVAFGVRNFENLPRGLSELQRVLKPTGRLVVLEFSKPQLPLIKQLYNFYFQHILPRIGRLLSDDPSAYTYLPASVQAFPEREAFVQLLTASGFKTASCIPLTFGICSIYVADK